MPIKKRPVAGLLPVEQPIQFTGGYVLDMYCRWQNPDHDVPNGHARFHGEENTDAIMEAIKAGWRIESGTRTGTCPKCLKAFNKARIANS